MVCFWIAFAIAAVVAELGARRDRLRVLGEQDGAAVHPADQRVLGRQGRPGAEDLPLVRPNQGLPLLLRPLEPLHDRVLCGRHADPGVQEQQGPRGAVPVRPAHEALLQPVERGRLGDPGRAGEDGLVQGALRRLLPGLPRRRLRGVRGGQVLRHPGRPLVGPARVPGPGRRAVPPPRLGQEGAHHLQLLHRPRPLRRHGARVQARPRRLSQRDCAIDDDILLLLVVIVVPLVAVR
uniref:Secreted protein n=1 Tax=Aegilops tauschii subsp. strangulata TaxID=200361 RepID=A0A453HUK6_AEGTS